MAPISKSGISGTLFLAAAVNHVLWSTLSVSSRYLQVYAEPPFDGLAVLAVCKVASAALLFSGGPFFCPDEKSNGGQTSSLSLHDHARPSWKKRLSFATLFGTVATCRGCLNIASTKFTRSYNINTINSLTPILVSIGDSMLLQTKLPQALWPCIFASCFGCALIALAQSPIVVNDNDGNGISEEYVFTSRDTVGCALQFGSTVFSSCARLLMKRTENILTRDEMVQTNNLFNILVPLVYTLLTNPNGWDAFLQLNVRSMFALSSIALLVFTVGSTGQMGLVRSMGAGVYSSLSALRVLGAVLFSSIFLNEPVQTWLEWMGIFITIVTITIYTLVSMERSTPAVEPVRNRGDASRDYTSGILMQCPTTGDSDDGAEQEKMTEIQDASQPKQHTETSPLLVY